MPSGVLLRAHEMWDQIERDSGEKIFHRVGGIIVGPPGSRAIKGSRASAQQWGLQHELLDAREIRKRFPALHPADDEIVLPFEIERQIQYFFTPAENFEDHPIYIWDREDANFDGFPEIDGATRHPIALFDPARLRGGS